MRSCNSREFLQRFWAFLIQHCYNTRSTKSLRLNQLGDKKINNIHPTIKFTADWSYSSVNFLDVKVIMKDGKIITDLYVKPTDTHQYLDSSSCHPYHCKKSIPYSQALRLNRICSNNAFFDQRCNELEHWLQQRGYSERVARQEILKAQKIPRNELLEKEHNHPEENKLTFNILPRIPKY